MQLHLEYDFIWCSIAFFIYGNCYGRVRNNGIAAGRPVRGGNINAFARGKFNAFGEKHLLGCVDPVCFYCSKGRSGFFLRCRCFLFLADGCNSSQKGSRLCIRALAKENNLRGYCNAITYRDADGRCIHKYIIIGKDRSIRLNGECTVIQLQCLLGCDYGTGLIIQIQNRNCYRLIQNKSMGRRSDVPLRIDRDMDTGVTADVQTSQNLRIGHDVAFCVHGKLDQFLCDRFITQHIVDRKRNGGGSGSIGKDYRGRNYISHHIGTDCNGFCSGKRQIAFHLRRFNAFLGTGVQTARQRKQNIALGVDAIDSIGNSDINFFADEYDTGGYGNARLIDCYCNRVFRKTGIADIFQHVKADQICGASGDGKCLMRNSFLILVQPQDINGCCTGSDQFIFRTVRLSIYDSQILQIGSGSRKRLLRIGVFAFRDGFSDLFGQREREGFIRCRLAGCNDVKSIDSIFSLCHNGQDVFRCDCRFYRDKCHKGATFRRKGIGNVRRREEQRNRRATIFPRDFQPVYMSFFLNRNGGNFSEFRKQENRTNLQLCPFRNFFRLSFAERKTGQETQNTEEYGKDNASFLHSTSVSFSRIDG